jgi:hypothetical protein
MAANLGFMAFVVSDATVAFERQGTKSVFPPDLVHEVSLASLQGEFATIVTTGEIVARLESGQNLEGALFPNQA